MSPTIIGLSTSWTKKELAKQAKDANSYVQAIEQFGAQTVFIPVDLSPRKLNNLIESLSGILLCGGGDIDPSRYGAIPSKLSHLKEIKYLRDALEFTLVRIAIDQHLPILGICRGIQVMNVALSGTLYQDLAAEHPDAFNHDQHTYDDGSRKPRDLLFHRVEFAEGSQVRSIYGKPEMRVNTLHHQGIRRLARKLTASGRVPEDNLVEAVELPSQPFFIGVQWHPEELVNYPEHQCIFKAFIEKATTFKPQ